MRISACLIVNLVRVHVKEGKPKSECNLIANGRTGLQVGPTNCLCLSHQLQHHFAT